MNNNNTKEFLYRHLAAQGTSYEIGKKEGEFIKKYYPEQIHFLTNGNDFIKPLSRLQIEKTIKLFDKYCPYLNEEIRGFADSIGVEHERVIYYSFSNVCSGSCGQFAVLPNMTENNHFYVGRSYEWDTGDDLRLITTKADGLNANMGFSLLLFGRYDGINEHGLCVTMTNGVPLKQSEEEGFKFWAVIRILLDKCKTVDEAVELINELPISSYCILCIADKNNNAVLAEINNSTKKYRKISMTTEDSYICSTNHYTLDEMQRFVKNKMVHSVERIDAIKRSLDKDRKLEKSELKNLLSTHIPDGLACHYYEEGLGTLWSILYDITSVKAEICFGSPVLNNWYTFGLDCEPGVTEYKAKLPFEKADPRMWMRV